MEAETARAASSSSPVAASTSDILAGNGALASQWISDLMSNGTLRTGRALVLSGAMTDEAITLARAGWHVTVVDPDGDRMKRLKGLARSQNASVTLVHNDVFRTRAAFYGSVDLVVERALLPSLNPVQRADWGFMVGRFLAKDGLLVGLFPIGRSHAGPPFPIRVEDLRRELERLFVVELLEPAGPSAPGQSQIWKGLFRRK